MIPLMNKQPYGIVRKYYQTNQNAGETLHPLFLMTSSLQKVTGLLTYVMLNSLLSCFGSQRQPPGYLIFFETLTFIYEEIICSLQFDWNYSIHLKQKREHLFFPSLKFNYCLPIHLTPFLQKKKKEEEKIDLSLITTTKLHDLKKSINFQRSASGVLSFNVSKKMILWSQDNDKWQLLKHPQKSSNRLTWNENTKLHVIEARSKMHVKVCFDS